MAARRRRDEASESRRKPATTPEELENEMISLAFDATRDRIKRGDASSQELTHFLKLGSSRERLEQERLAHENELTRVKIEHMAAQSRIEELYVDAIKAMRSYAPPSEPEPVDEPD